MLFIALLLSVQTASIEPGPIFVGREPRPPQRMIHATEVTCGDDVLRVTGYGVGVPRGATPEISFNGQRLLGAYLLEEDLRGRPGGVFRISATCAPWESRIYLVIDYAQRLLPDGFSYQAGSAIIERGNLVEYRSLSESNFETFWSN